MTGDNRSAQTIGLRERIEDHALEPVPREQRRSGWGLMTNTAGIASTLVQLGIGGVVTVIAGVGYGILAGVIAAVLTGTLGWLVGHVAYVSGTSSTVTARYYGLGVRGSALASLIFAFMILGFLALENALLYAGTLFMFGWSPTIGNAVVIYGLLTIVWILLTTFGIAVVQRTSLILLTVFMVLTIGMAVVTLAGGAMSVGELLSTGPADPSGGDAANIALALSILAGTAGALALVDADFARYARSTRDVGILAVGGAIVIDIVVVVLGAIIVHAGSSSVSGYLNEHPDVAAAQQGEVAAEKVIWMVQHNTGAFFVVLAGLLGFVLMYVAQAKAQVLNTYSGSLALSNLVDAVTRHNPGRLTLVIAGNVIALLMVAGDILGFITSYLGLLGVMTFALVGLIIADFFVVRRRQVATAQEREPANWAGVTSMIVATVVGGTLLQMGVTSLGFLIALAVVLVTYPLLRMTILRPRVHTAAPIEEEVSI